MPTYKALRKPGRGEALLGKRLGAPVRGFSAFPGPGPEESVDLEARVEQAAAGVIELFETSLRHQLALVSSREQRASAA